MSEKSPHDQPAVAAEEPAPTHQRGNVYVGPSLTSSLLRVVTALATARG